MDWGVVAVYKLRRRRLGDICSGQIAVELSAGRNMHEVWVSLGIERAENRVRTALVFNAEYAASCCLVTL